MWNAEWNVGRRPPHRSPLCFFKSGSYKGGRGELGQSAYLLLDGRSTSTGLGVQRRAREEDMVSSIICPVFEAFGF